MKKKGRRLWILLLTVLLSFGAMTGEVSAASVKISKSSAVIMKKQKLRLKVTGTKKKVTWSSTNKKVAKVTSKGVVTGVKAGKATIKAKVGRVSYSCKVTVKNDGLDKTKVSLVAGKSDVVKLYGTKIKSVSTNKKSVAVISKRGKITAKKAGKAKLTIRGTNGKKYTCVVTVTPKITGVSLNRKSLELLTGKTAKLTASVKPAKAANRKVTFKSSNTAVAKVSSSGVVTAVGAGTAKITVTASGNSSKKAVCSVTVRNTVVTTQNELNEIGALTELGAKEITLRSDERTDFTVPRVECPDTKLVVDVPNANVVNEGSCGQIVVKSVASSFVEQAAGNDIVYQDTSGKITIGSEAKDTNVHIEGQGSDIEIENNGSLAGLWLNVLSRLRIAGQSSQRIPTTAQPGSAGSTVITCKNLELSAEAKITMILEEGAEHTTAVVSNGANIPVVRGLGSVEVTNRTTNDVDTVVAENDDSVSGLRSVTMEGVIQSYEGSALAGASVYLIKYSSSINTDNILNYAGGAKSCTTDASGRYFLEGVTLGNYYLAAVMADRQTVVQTIIINSDTGNNCSNETILMLPAGMTGAGSVSGMVVDAGTGYPVSYPVTLKIRRGGGNQTGAALQTVTVPGGGQYFFGNLAAGVYTVQAVSGAGGQTEITTNYSNVMVVPGTDTVYNITVTPVLSSGEVRFVLRWGTEASGAPEDLDSHLVGPAEDGGKFHIWYSNKDYHGGQMYCELDVDDIGWEGPETSTVRNMVNGIYDFYVFDCSNQSKEDSEEMSQHSDACVQVYDGDVLRATYYIPKGKTGNLWHVCSFDSVSRRLTEVNTVGYWPSGGGRYIGFSLIDAEKDKLIQKMENLQSLCEDKLPDGEYKTAVLSVLDRARILYDSSQDHGAVRDMCGELDRLIAEVSDMPDRELVSSIDQAVPLQIGQAVSFEISGTVPVYYYAFTPSADGYYTFRITSATEGSEPYCSLYNQYEFESSKSYDSLEGAVIMSRYLTAGRKYTFAVSENAVSSSVCTAVLTQERYVSQDEFYNVMNSVEYFYEFCYIADASVSAEIGAVLDQAREVYENYPAQDMETVAALYEKLLEYDAFLQDLSDESEANDMESTPAAADLELTLDLGSTDTEAAEMEETEEDKAGTDVLPETDPEAAETGDIIIDAETDAVIDDMGAGDTIMDVVSETEDIPAETEQNAPADAENPAVADTFPDSPESSL